jgi:putative ABC transport system permease protein
MGDDDMGSLSQDVRYSIRMLLKQPLFTAAAVITLALGIGANSAIFSVVNAVLLKPLPYPEPQQLITLRNQESVPDLDDIKQRSQSFDSFGSAVVQDLDFTGGVVPLKVESAMINTDLFAALGAKPAVGRLFTADEDRYDGERVVVLSHGFWQRQFAGDTTVIGKSIQLSGNAYTVVGVMPADFVMPRETPDLFVSLRVVNPLAAKARGVHFLRTYLRLKHGVTIQQAQSELDSISAVLEQQYPDENKDRHRRAVPLQERLTGESRTPLLVLLGAVGLLLLVSCANFSSLLLARAAARQHELAIRTALGAGRARLIRQVITESVLLSLLGGVAGLVLALWGVDLLVALKPADLPLVADIGIDRWVLAFTFIVAVLTGLIFGLVPALSSSRFNTNEVLKEGGRNAPGGVVKHRIRSVLVVSEIALAVMLLIASGLLIKGFWRLRSVNPGFDAEHLLTMRLELPETRYKEIAAQTQFRNELLQRLNSLPGVQAAMVSELPLSGSQLTHNFVIDGRPPLSPGDEPELNTRSIGGDYFRTMKIPVLQGRDLTPQDTSSTPTVGLVNESFVRQYFPGADPIGARIRWVRGKEPKWMTIVGIVADVKHFGLNLPEEPAFYYSYSQLDQPWKRWMFLVVRGNSDVGALASEVKSQLKAVDGLLPVSRVQPMTGVMSVSIASQRFNMILMGVFGLTALLLAAVGIYGVVSFSVTHRTHEIGIRIALGARSRDVLRLVVGEGLRLGLVGVIIGVAGAMLVTRLMVSLLFGVSATDPATFVFIGLVLVGVALLACYVPARRAAKVDPMVALRYE